MIPVFKVVKKQPAGTASDVLSQNLICFLMNFGTECLRQLVYSTVKKEDLVKLFSSEKIAAEVSQLMASNKLTQEQCHMLKDNPDPESFEISLLMILLTNENIFQLPDKTVIHDLKCLREIRRGLLHHSKLISKTLFEGYLQQMSGIFKRITHHVNVEKQPGMKLHLKNEKYLTRQLMQVPDSNLFLSFINWHLQDTDNYQTSLEILQLKTTNLLDGNKDMLLPPSWATGDSPDGRLFYVNLDTRTASWVLNTVQDTTRNAEKKLLETVDPLSKVFKKLDQNQKSRQQSSQEDQSAGLVQPNASQFRPPTDNILDQPTTYDLYNSMSKVGAIIINGDLKGSLFRIGKNYGITALHVISQYCFNTVGTDIDLDILKRLDHLDIFVNFNETYANTTKKFRIKYCFHIASLDILIVKFTTVAGLPPRLYMIAHDREFQSVHAIGWSDKTEKKILEPNCKVVQPAEIEDAKKNLIEKINLRANSPDVYDKGYNTDIDMQDICIYHGRLRFDGSGSPIFVALDEGHVGVHAVLIGGIPEIYYHLPQGSIERGQIPEKDVFNIAVKMKSIVREVQKSDPGLAQKIFNE